SISFLALMVGVLFNFLYDAFGGGKYASSSLPLWLKEIAGIILAFLIIVAYGRKWFRKEEKMENKLYVPDMKCRNCRATIEKALTDAGIEKFSISLEKKTVGFVGDMAIAKKAIKVAGYSVEEK
ncbi:MAG TPA: copper chaperone, partial [Thermoplasmatales archaeon]|nr:copper chaperone [Thermoplasmatales archaeon]